mmetsp:Transcript_9881/g.26038  ORF Transcript_9881/g.26038 Transcript_9881/m.26038 type:complete len:204 (-) Transcript_9881:1653-2264(-)
MAETADACGANSTPRKRWCMGRCRWSGRRGCAEPDAGARGPPAPRRPFVRRPCRRCHATAARFTCGGAAMAAAWNRARGSSHDERRLSVKLQPPWTREQTAAAQAHVPRRLVVHLEDLAAIAPKKFQAQGTVFVDGHSNMPTHNCDDLDKRSAEPDHATLVGNAPQHSDTQEPASGSHFCLRGPRIDAQRSRELDRRLERCKV